MRAKIFERNGYFRYVHFIMLGLAIVVPCIPVAVVEATGGSAVVTFPPFQCYARTTDVIYYTYLLPGSIMWGTGATLVILILQVIIHVRASRTGQEKDLQAQVHIKLTIPYFVLRQLYSMN